MSNYTILAWQPLLRPSLSDVEPPIVPHIALKALTCRNQVISLSALITSEKPAKSACLHFTDLVGIEGKIDSELISTRLVGAVPTPEAGMVCDPVYEVDEFPIDKSATLLVTIKIPKGIPAGTYLGVVALEVDNEHVAHNDVEVEVADVDLPDVHDWKFFLNVWMNPAAIARWYKVDLWSDEHFTLLKSYIEDLAAHGQKTVVAPICYQPWGTQTYTPYPNLITWKKRNGNYEFDFSVFDRYVKLHEDCGIDRAIHCYSIVQGLGGADKSVVEYIDAETGEKCQVITTLGDAEYVSTWGAFFSAFKSHLIDMGWMDKVYIAFDEKPGKVMASIVDFMSKYAADFKISLAANSRNELFNTFDDLSLSTPFEERGIAELIPAERTVMGMADLLDPDNVCAVTHSCPEKSITTYYVCCVPEFPNTFVHSPLVESRMLPFLAAQGGYDGLLRWSYNDWPEDLFNHPEYGVWPTGDTFFVYPGENGPVSSLRWEQLREGIQDFELAMIASANIQTPDEIVDYEQAISLACRSVDGREKSIGDIEIARRLLIPIAAHKNE